MEASEKRQETIVRRRERAWGYGYEDGVRGVYNNPYGMGARYRWSAYDEGWEAGQEEIGEKPRRGEEEWERWRGLEWEIHLMSPMKWALRGGWKAKQRWADRVGNGKGWITRAQLGELQHARDIGDLEAGLRGASERLG